VIAIMRPDVQVTLLESRGKKAEFLRSVAVGLELDLTVLRGRAEELARSHHAGSYELVTARAVAPLERLLPWTLPFLRPGGLLYAVKGERWQEELEAAASTMARLRGRVVATPSDLDLSDPQAPKAVIVARDG
jgi:16S rRNA (guanine527-N7)-methyltransferase